MREGVKTVEYLFISALLFVRREIFYLIIHDALRSVKKFVQKDTAPSIDKKRPNPYNV